MANPADELAALGRARFADLTAPEEVMLRAAAIGEAANFEGLPPGGGDPANAAQWGPERTIRAAVIRWLCTDRDAAQWVDPHGLMLWAAKVTERVDLRHARVPFPLALMHCALADGLVLQDATLPGLHLDGSHTGPIDADGLEVKGDVSLNEGFTATGAVRLRGASVGGDLSCRGGTFNNAEGDALNADGLGVKGDVFLDNGFTATGGVRLLGASVGGDLSCRGGAFNNAGGDALCADCVEVKGNVFLDNGFTATGEVRLRGASVGGDLICRGGTFNNAGGNALGAGGLGVKGSVFLDEGFSATGTVNLARASAGVLADAEECWPRDGALFLDGFSYGAIAPGSSTDAKCRIKWLGLRRWRPRRPARFWSEAKRRIKWLGLQPAGAFRPQPYVQLARVLKQMGHNDDARQVLIELERERIRAGGLNGWRRAWRRFLGFTFGFGYQLYRPLIGLAGFLLLGILLFRLGDGGNLISPAKERVYMDAALNPATKGEAGAGDQAIPLFNNQRLPADYPNFSPFMYSLDTLVPLVNFHMEDYWVPDADRRCDAASHGLFGRLARVAGLPPRGEYRCGMWLRRYLWLHIAAGWFCSTLLAAGLSGLVRKEE
ncbi:MAG: hypothetical protein HZA24_10540 [Nitrospirae bacterium]|nr:hypothetical protein [Nitrospirota bacterium]